MTLLKVSDLHTEFQTDNGTVKAVNGVNLTIEKGETVGLVGESGSGKSVTALSLMRLIDSPGQITQGEIIFKNIDLFELNQTELQQIRGNEIGMIFQEPIDNLNPVIPIGEQIAETLQAHGYCGENLSRLDKSILEAFLPRRHPKKRHPKSWQRAIKLMKDVGIPEAEQRASEYAHQFSGGMQQRAVIAEAIACEPRLIIADEPTTALDVTIEAQILELLNALKREQDMGILFITHDLGVVSEMCDRMAVMYAGQIVESGPVDELFESPKHPYTKGLIEAVPDMNSGKRVKATGGNVPNLSNLKDKCRFAPRCDYAHEACYKQVPEMFDVDSSSVRCILYDDSNFSARRMEYAKELEKDFDESKPTNKRCDSDE